MININTPHYECLWCSHKKSIFSIVALADQSLHASKYLCNDCILMLAGQFLRGRLEFNLARLIEKFIGHKLPFEIDINNTIVNDTFIQGEKNEG